MSDTATALKTKIKSLDESHRLTLLEKLADAVANMEAVLNEKRNVFATVRTQSDENLQNIITIIKGQQVQRLELENEKLKKELKTVIMDTSKVEGLENTIKELTHKLNTANTALSTTLEDKKNIEEKLNRLQDQWEKLMQGI
ncbi:hypothetical protein [Candidatus Magnetomonas plexicatena]|uniref:hypothetical protein n=1 Tax=Candidatus Magnetomonas plexicatena TaxID=2552947 RepID=UPI001C7647C5|nr:hypothetical protein E2O03_011535 [Nitrospirales bacterium LBB_01]